MQKLDGKDQWMAAIDPATFGQVQVVDVASGSMAGLTDTGIVIDEGYAKDHKLVVGDKVDALLANTPATLTVAGIFKSAAGLPSETLSPSASGRPRQPGQGRPGLCQPGRPARTPPR